MGFDQSERAQGLIYIITLDNLTYDISRRGVNYETYADVIKIINCKNNRTFADWL